MGIDLYYASTSAPCRSVLLTAKAIGLDLNLIIVDITGGENRTPEFLKMNPQHNIPTLNDNGFCLNESRAIITYLVEKYGNNVNLYPKDSKKRAVINQRLYFDIGTLYAAFAACYAPNIFAGVPLQEHTLKRVRNAFEFLEVFLGDSDYVTGNNMTIADLAIVASVSTFEALDFNFTPYPKVAKWLAKMKAEAPGYEEANGYGSAEFKKMAKPFKKANFLRKYHMFK